MIDGRGVNRNGGEQIMRTEHVYKTNFPSKTGKDEDEDDVGPSLHFIGLRIYNPTMLSI